MDFGLPLFIMYAGCIGDGCVKVSFDHFEMLFKLSGWLLALKCQTHDISTPVKGISGLWKEAWVEIDTILLAAP